MSNNDNPAPMTSSQSSEQTALASYFAKRYPDDQVSVTDFKPAAAGFSSQTRLFNLHLTRAGKTTSRALVVRWAPSENRQFENYDVAFQYQVMRTLAGTTVPVPEMVLLETDPTIFGSPFFVMAKVEGDVTSDHPPGYHGAGFLFESAPADRASVWQRTIEVMANLHRIDWRQEAWSFLDRPRDAADALTKRLALIRSLVDWASKTPIEPIERALKWLAANIPQSSRLGLAWGDARHGNIIFRDYRPVVALDWETLHVAPPESDLAYLILVDEVAFKAHGVPRLAGLPSAEDTIAYYEEISGHKVDAMAYYFVLEAAWLSVMLAITAKNVLAIGMPGFPLDYAQNNVGIARLEQLLQDVC